MGRFSNIGLWVSLFALFGLVAKDFFGADIDPGRYQLYVDTILALLVFLGVVNNPTTKNKWYTDDK